MRVIPVIQGERERKEKEKEKSNEIANSAVGREQEALMCPAGIAEAMIERATARELKVQSELQNAQAEAWGGITAARKLPRG